ncbi:DUF6276 family protein [Haloarchaeobius amylolyticus]|uniref:DUF6276 family protein n=1 Tax=Haloarchaeobius amylolyticus TaxID=1198296 RepID=A0ABD6BDS9_9EURY
MACSNCETATISFSVPEDYRTDAPSEASVVSFCPHCLTLEPASDREPAARNEPDFSRVSDTFPTQPERAVPLALALGLCSSLATNRTAIELLLREVERAGTDPLLVLDRLIADPSIDPAIDLERRRHQLEQLLY